MLPKEMTLLTLSITYKTFIKAEKMFTISLDTDSNANFTVVVFQDDTNSKIIPTRDTKYFMTSQVWDIMNLTLLRVQGHLRVRFLVLYRGSAYLENIEILPKGVWDFLVVHSLAVFEVFFNF